MEHTSTESKDYHTVSIIGCQSTGKSTLLNLLFETSFDTLDATKGRNQTTRGIHLAFNQACKALVVDIEGTDSQIRGDDGAAFEQMSALFALAISDVLMVNMWTSEIGRYKAASVGLLKTIFEVNLKLFGVEGKKRVLFVLRDFNEEKNNMSILKQQISKTMEEIWDKIKKPASHALSTVFECFEFDFHTVSVKDFKPEEFIRDIHSLKDKFSNPERSDYLFRYKNTDIPIDGISLYFSEIWNLIHSDKDLNIPSQKEMLANLRCTELKQEALKKFQEDAVEITKNIGKTFIPDLGNTFIKLYEASLQAYDEHASGYYEATYNKIRSDLQQGLNDQSKELFAQQMKLVVSLLMQRTREGFVHKFPKSISVDNYKQLVSEIFYSVKNEFQNLASASLVSGSNWTVEEYENEVNGFFNEKKNDEKEKQERLLETEIGKVFDSKFLNEISKVLDQSMEGDVWEKLRSLQVNTLQNLESRTAKAYSNLEKSHDEIHAYIEQVRLLCVNTMRTRLDKFAQNLEEFLLKKFNTLFQKDEKGIPRDPKTANYEEIFSKSKDKVLPILENFRFFKLNPDWEETLSEHLYGELLTEEMYEKILENFLKDAERTYKDALHIKEFGYNKGGLPKWAILLLVLLGWNELLWVLSSPIVLYPAMLLGSGVALMFSMGLGAIPKLLFSQVLSKVPFLF